jgi:hypothetical protein
MTSSNPQEQYLQAVQQTQDAFAAAMKNWTDTVSKMMGSAAPASALPTGLPAGTPTPAAVVDQVFDFAQAMLDAQRRFAKQLLEAAASAQVAKPD